MNLTEDQIKDLRSFKVMELPLNGHFYLMNPDKSFDHCKIDDTDMKYHGADTLKWLCDRSKERRLFTRINQPFKPFAIK